MSKLPAGVNGLGIFVIESIFILLGKLAHLDTDEGFGGWALVVSCWLLVNYNL